MPFTKHSHGGWGGSGDTKPLRTPQDKGPIFPGAARTAFLSPMFCRARPRVPTARVLWLAKNKRKPNKPMPSDTNNSTEYSEKYLHVKQKAVERAQKRGETGTRVAAPRSQRLPPGQYLTDKFPVLDLGVQPMFLPDKFRLKVDGAVKNPVSLSLADLTQLPSIELTADFHCVTHWSRYDLHWTGIPFESLVDLVEPEGGVSHVMQYGKDGYTTNNTLSDLMHPDVIVAYALDGQPIPREHGAPIRIITPHLYAWKGAKFLNRIEFLTADKLGFWEQRGYHNHADPWTEERFS